MKKKEDGKAFASAGFPGTLCSHIEHKYYAFCNPRGFRAATRFSIPEDLAFWAAR